MGLVCVLSTMLAIIMLTWLISRWDARAAYRLLETSQSLFEPDEEPRGPQQNTTTSLVPNKRSGVAASPNRARENERKAAPQPVKRYVTPLTKKRVAARQSWRCNCGCKRLLDDSYEIDHIVPISEGGTNKEDNLQALLRSCHQRKSAREQAR